MSSVESFETFMKNYQDMVYTTAVRLLGNTAEAEDISQEVFLKVYERFPEMEGITHVGGWLRRVTTNLCLNHLTRYRNRWRFFSEMENQETNEDFTVHLAAPEEDSLPDTDRDRRALLEQILHQLPVAQRVPLVLYHFEELSYDEIAVRLGVSLSKVKIDSHRGRETLRRKLATVAGQELTTNLSPA
jgi:RNA polymerase sigma-70 factor (ECF subfamily)